MSAGDCRIENNFIVKRTGWHSASMRPHCDRLHQRLHFSQCFPFGFKIQSNLLISCDVARMAEPMGNRGQVDAGVHRTFAWIGDLPRVAPRIK
jgi:hypothetical protein